MSLLLIVISTLLTRVILVSNNEKHITFTNLRGVETEDSKIGTFVIFFLSSTNLFEALGHLVEKIYFFVSPNESLLNYDQNSI